MPKFLGRESTGRIKTCRYIQHTTGEFFSQVGRHQVIKVWVFNLASKGETMKQRAQPLERPYEHPTSHCEPFIGDFAVPTHIHGGQKYV